MIAEKGDDNFIYIIVSFFAERSRSQVAAVAPSAVAKHGYKDRSCRSPQWGRRALRTAPTWVDMGPISKPKGSTRCIRHLFKSFVTVAGSAGRFSSAIQNVLPVVVPPAQPVLTAAARVSTGYDTASHANNSWHKLPWSNNGQTQSREHGTQEQDLFCPENGKRRSEGGCACRKGSGLLWWPFTVR